jgi:hypothetical protein
METTMKTMMKTMPTKKAMKIKSISFDAGSNGNAAG